VALSQTKLPQDKPTQNHGGSTAGANSLPLIVVGIKQSETDLEILRWAAIEAELRDAKIEIVVVNEHNHFHELAMTRLRKAIAELSTQFPATSIKVRVHEGDVATVLLKASEHADLLILGSPAARAGDPARMLRSPACRCITLASVPIAIFRSAAA
jgi:nucleotide-binding universal stress UspA family protein